MVKTPRYVLEQLQSDGGVVRSDLFKTQREVVAALPPEEKITPSMIREFFRTVPRVRTGTDARKAKYKKFNVRKYVKKHVDTTQR